MEVVYKRCAGLDVHKKTVVVCVIVTDATGKVGKEVRIPFWRLSIIASLLGVVTRRR